METEHTNLWKYPALPAGTNTTSVEAPLLQVSDEDVLGKTRHDLLRRAGHDVHTCRSLDVGSLHTLFTSKLAAVVVCQSVSEKVASTLAEDLKRNNGKLTVIRFTKRPWLEINAIAFDLIVQAPLDPINLIQTMERIRSRIGSTCTAA